MQKERERDRCRKTKGVIEKQIEKQKERDTKGTLAEKRRGRKKEKERVTEKKREKEKMCQNRSDLVAAAKKNNKMQYFKTAIQAER